MVTPKGPDRGLIMRRAGETCHWIHKLWLKCDIFSSRRGPDWLIWDRLGRADWIIFAQISLTSKVKPQMNELLIITLWGPWGEQLENLILQYFVEARWINCLSLNCEVIGVNNLVNRHPKYLILQYFARTKRATNEQKLVLQYTLTGFIFCWSKKWVQFMNCLS